MVSFTMTAKNQNPGHGAIETIPCTGVSLEEKSLRGMLFPVGWIQSSARRARVLLVLGILDAVDEGATSHRRGHFLQA